MITRILFICTLLSFPFFGSTQTGTWLEKSDMLAARKEIANAAVALDGKIYVIGGVLSDGSITNKFESYDPSADTWEALAAYPLSVWRATAAAVNGKIYVFGGFQSLNPFPFNPSNKVYEYDPSTDSWTAKANLLTARGAATAVTVGGEIHLLGGAANSALNLHHVYDPATDNWSTATAMSASRSGMTANVIEGKIYAVGGYFLGGGVVSQSTAEAYDPATESWSAIADLPFTKLGMASAVVRGKLYVFGNENNANPLEYDPDSDAWQQLTPMPENVNFAGVAAVGDTIYVMGGGPVNLNRFDAKATTNCFLPDLVNAVGSVDAIPGFVLKNIFPNPVENEAVVEYELAKRAAVSISIISPSGQILETFVNEIQQSGTHKTQWNVSPKMGSGIYFLQIIIDGKTVTRKLVLQ